MKNAVRILLVFLFLLTSPVIKPADYYEIRNVSFDQENQEWVIQMKFQIFKNGMPADDVDVTPEVHVKLPGCSSYKCSKCATLCLNCVACDGPIYYGWWYVRLYPEKGTKGEYEFWITVDGHPFKYTCRLSKTGIIVRPLTVTILGNPIITGTIPNVEVVLEARALGGNCEGDYTYIWRFDDGSPPEETKVPVVVHTFTEERIYNIIVECYCDSEFAYDQKALHITKPSEGSAGGGGEGFLHITATLKSGSLHVSGTSTVILVNGHGSWINHSKGTAGVFNVNCTGISVEGVITNYNAGDVYTITVIAISSEGNTLKGVTTYPVGAEAEWSQDFQLTLKLMEEYNETYGSNFTDLYEFITYLSGRILANQETMESKYNEGYAQGQLAQRSLDEAEIDEWRTKYRDMENQMNYWFSEYNKLKIIGVSPIPTETPTEGEKDFFGSYLPIIVIGVILLFGLFNRNKIKQIVLEISKKSKKGGQIDLKEKMTIRSATEKRKPLKEEFGDEFNKKREKIQFAGEKNEN